MKLYSFSVKEFMESPNAHWWAHHTLWKRREMALQAMTNDAEAHLKELKAESPKTNYRIVINREVIDILGGGNFPYDVRYTLEEYETDDTEE